MGAYSVLSKDEDGFCNKTDEGEVQLKNICIFCRGAILSKSE